MREVTSYSDQQADRIRQHFLQNRQFIHSIVAMLITLLSIAIFTRILPGFVIKRPFDFLNRILVNFSDGIYHLDENEPVPREFKPVVSILRYMGAAIVQKIDELEEAGWKYRGIFENTQVGIFHTSPGGQDKGLATPVIQRHRDR